MDIQVLLFFQNLREATGGLFNDFFLFVTELGWSILPPLILAGIYWSIDKKSGRYIFSSARMADTLANTIKITACIYRPWVRDPAIKPLDAAVKTATGYSFPSGHSTFGTGLWGGIAVSFRKNKIIRNCAIIIIPLILISRLYVGVHTPQDVTVGCAVALFMLWAAKKLMDWAEKDDRNFFWIMVASAVLFVMIIVYAELKSYPVDYADGVILVEPAKMKLNGLNAAAQLLAWGAGMYLENRYVKFSTDVDMNTRIARFMAGGLTYIFIFNLLSPFLKLFIPKPVAGMAAEFLGVLFVLYIHPVIFTAYEKKHAAALSNIQ